MFKKIILFFVFSFYLLKAQENSHLKANSKISNSLEAPIEESLKDVIKYDSDTQKHNLEEKKTYLLGNAIIEYQDIKIEADYIEITWNTNEVYAKGKIDESKNIISPAIFLQGKEKKEKVEYESFLFNFKTKKGISYNVRTEPKEGVIFAKKVKQNEENIKLMKDVIFTTDDYYREKKDPEPDFYLKTDKLKYIEKKSAITGPLWIYLYKSPLPLPLPFFYLPLDKKNSGIHIPQIQEFANRGGLSLEGFGFYWAISDYLDSDTKGDFYLNGGFRLKQEFKFKKRYVYSGDASFNYNRHIEGVKGLEETNSYYKKYKKDSNYNIKLNYRLASGYSPSLDLNVDVNYNGKAENFDRLNPSFDLTNSRNNYGNASATSSINLTKKFEKFNPITFRTNLNQNFTNKKINLTFPQISTSYNKNPFSDQQSAILKNFQLNYRFNLDNKVSELDNKDLFTKKLFQEMKSGIRQEVNLHSSKVFFEHFTFTPHLNFYENWVLNTLEKIDDPKYPKGKDQRKNEFKTFRTFDLSGSLNFTLTKLKTFQKAKLLAIRHQITPEFTFTYSPDFSTPFWGYYKSYKGEKYNIFSGSLNGSISNRASRRIQIGLNNNVEIKIRDEKAAKKERKIKIFERFNITTAYDFEKVDFKWNSIGFEGNTPLIKNSSLSYNFTLDPYKKSTNEQGKSQRINQLGGFHLEAFNANLNFSLDQNTFSKEKKEKTNYSKKGKIRYEKFFFDKNNYARYEIPWNLNFRINYDYSKYNSAEASHNGSINLSGGISPTPYWSIDINSNYSFKENKISQLGLTFKRDIRSFIMRFSWNPIAHGPIRTWGFNIGFKPSILSSIKFNRRNEIGG